MVDTPNNSTAPTQPKRLYRSRSDRMIAGVCGGLAEYFHIDPVIMRIIAVVLLLPGGLPGFVPYVILWIVVPEKPAESSDSVAPPADTPPASS